MKTLLIGACALLISTPAFAQDNETFSDLGLTAGLSQVDSTAARLLEDCMAPEASSRAVRACTKSIRGSVAVPGIRAELYSKRGLHQLSMGRFEKAARDFATAGRLDGENALASLGAGYAALMENRLDEARARFRECGDHEGANALAQYGMGMTYQVEGRTDAAREAYRRAAELRPGWDAPRESLAAL